jgi:hypothetical protein
MVDEEIRRVAKVLEAVVKLSDFSTRELERRLELGGGTLNRIFTGKIDLKLRHVLLVLEVVGMKPERFFQLACARPAAGDEGGSSLAADILESFQRFGYSIGRPPPPRPTGRRPTRISTAGSRPPSTASWARPRRNPARPAPPCGRPRPIPPPTADRGARVRRAESARLAPGLNPRRSTGAAAAAAARAR